MYEKFGDLDASIQSKLDGDTEFQDSLVDLSDEDKETTIQSRKAEMLDEEIKSLGEKTKKNEELANNYKTRAEKAEQELKKNKPNGEGSPQNPEFSIKDQVALGKINEEDIDEVVRVAKVLGKSVSEAMKDPVLKTILDNREELRTSANVANTNNVRRGSVKVSDEELLSKANTGKLPESDDEIARLYQARARKK